MTKRANILIVFVLLFLVACKDTGSPQYIAQRFLYSVRSMDFEVAKSLSTKNTWSFLNIMKSFTDSIPPEVKESYAKDLKITITSVVEESDSTVIVSYEATPKVLPFNKFRMQKSVDINGRDRWKVDISTIDLVDADSLIIEEENKAVFDEGIEFENARGADSLSSK